MQKTIIYRRPMGENLLEEEFKAEALSQMGNPLEKLASLVDFEMFRPALEDVVIKKKCKRQCNLWLHILFFTLVLPILFSTYGCSYESPLCSRLSHIDSLMEVRPDDAYDSLCQITLPEDADRSTAMKYHMLKAKAENKLYKPLPSDTVFQRVADYYYRHGSANEKMLSQYLLGCICRDRGDAPESLEHFMNALSYADTTAADCDYYTLAGVYGQMAEIYAAQNFYDKVIECNEAYSRYSMKTGRIKEYIHGKNIIIMTMCEMGDTLGYLNNIGECIQLYKDNGMPEEAAAAMHSLIYVHLQRHEYDSARHYMQIYEKESGLFVNNKPDTSVPSACFYNYSKGLYYEGTGNLDSAEYFYRELHKYGNRMQAYKGLLNVYSQRLNADSIKKYMHLYESAYDSYLKENQMKAIAQANSMYDYNKLKRVIAENKNKEERKRWVLAVVSLAVLTLAFYSYRVFISYKRRKEAEFEAHRHKIAAIRAELQTSSEELDNMRKDFQAAFRNKQEEIEILSSRIAEYESANTKIQEDSVKQMEELHDYFTECINYYRNGDNHAFKQKDLNRLSAYIRDYHADLHKRIQKARLTNQEKIVCELTFIGIPSGDIALYLSVTPQRLSNIKAECNNKLFGENSAKELYSNMVGKK